MTSVRPAAPVENVVAGSLLALLVVPVGIAILVLLWSAGFVASIVGFVVAFGAVFLYRRGSGGLISRTGAWILTAIVLGTLLIGLWLSLAVDYAGGLKHLDNFGIPEFWTDFGNIFWKLVGEEALSVILVIVFGALGSFRTLGRAFAISRVNPNAAATSGSTAMPSASTPTTYKNDVDAPPTGSADDKTKPPTSDR